MVHVPLDWKKIDWMPNEKWADTAKKLELLGVKVKELKRSIYVIRLNGEYCVAYHNGTSPTLYIGRGNFKQRIDSHRKNWISELKEMVGEFSFQICIVVPRVRKCPNAFLDVEAALLQRFELLFDTLPLWNSRIENGQFEHEYSLSQIDQAICKRSGSKYKWAIAPMRSSTFYTNFHRTHRPRTNMLKV